MLGKLPQSKGALQSSYNSAQASQVLLAPFLRRWNKWNSSAKRAKVGISVQAAAAH